MTLTGNDPYDPHAAKRCTAHSSRTGKPCKGFRVPGATVCKMHGGSAPQVRAKAQQRLTEAADRMARQLLHMATDETVADTVKLAAIRDALDRAGVTQKTAVEIQVTTKPYEELLGGMATMTRAESRAARGIPDDTPRWVPPALPPGEIVDVEVVADPSGPVGEMPATDRGNGCPEPTQPGNGLMTLAEANEALRDSQRRYNEGY